MPDTFIRIHSLNPSGSSAAEAARYLAALIQETDPSRCEDVFNTNPKSCSSFHFSIIPIQPLYIPYYTIIETCFSLSLLGLLQTRPLDDLSVPGSVTSRSSQTCKGCGFNTRNTGLSKKEENDFGGPHNKDYNRLGSILGSAYAGKLPHIGNRVLRQFTHISPTKIKHLQMTRHGMPGNGS